MGFEEALATGLLLEIPDGHSALMDNGRQKAGFDGHFVESALQDIALLNFPQIDL